MSIFFKILYKLKLLKLTEWKVNHWIITKQYDKLVFASKNGNYKVRLILVTNIIELLENVKIKNTAIELIDDKVQIISKKAMEISTIHFNKSDSKLMKRINDKKEYWTEKELDEKNKTSTIKFKQTWKDNKDSMVRLKQIKQQIKKSMYGEKWM